MLRWTWPIGEFSGVYLLCSVSFLVSFFLVEVEWRGIHVWYSPALVQTRLALQTSPTFSSLGCLAPVGPWAAGHPRSVLTHLLPFNKLFLCGFLQVCSTVSHWPVPQGLGAPSVFFCQDGCWAWRRAGLGTGLGSTLLPVNQAVRNPWCAWWPLCVSWCRLALFWNICSGVKDAFLMEALPFQHEFK